VENRNGKSFDSFLPLLETMMRISFHFSFFFQTDQKFTYRETLVRENAESSLFSQKDENRMRVKEKRESLVFLR